MSPGFTLTEKILGQKTGRRVAPGEIIEVEPDFIGIHDILGHTVVDLLEKHGVSSLPYPERIGVFIDHAVPAPSPLYSSIHRQLREFVREKKIGYFSDAGNGIMHNVIIQEKLVSPGDILIASDSHTVTVGAIGVFAVGMGSSDIAYAMATGKTWLRVPESIKVEFEGRLKTPVTSKDVALYLLGENSSSWANYKSIEYIGGIRVFSLNDRITLANMSTEMGAKAALFPSDEVIKKFFGKKSFSPVVPEGNPVYSDEFFVELNKIEPMVSLPHRVDNVKSVYEVEGTEIDTVFLGSCTSGVEEDFIMAAKVLKGKKISDSVRCIAIPATRKIYQNLLDIGIVKILVGAGCIVTYGTCGPCWGGHFGVAGPGETVLSTSNRNFKGRMGDPTAKIYLASPYTVAASSLEGRIVSPEKYVGG